MHYRFTVYIYKTVSFLTAFTDFFHLYALKFKHLFSHEKKNASVKLLFYRLRSLFFHYFSDLGILYFKIYNFYAFFRN
jgi:hypothetical protein